jgi:hypothetical protein
MPDNRRPWTEEEIAKLKSMAGKLALRQIAAELGRTPRSNSRGGIQAKGLTSHGSVRAERSLGGKA